MRARKAIWLIAIRARELAASLRLTEEETDRRDPDDQRELATAVTRAVERDRTHVAFAKTASVCMISNTSNRPRDSLDQHAGLAQPKDRARNRPGSAAKFGADVLDFPTHKPTRLDHLDFCCGEINTRASFLGHRGGDAFGRHHGVTAKPGASVNTRFSQ